MGEQPTRIPVEVQRVHTLGSVIKTQWNIATGNREQLIKRSNGQDFAIGGKGVNYSEFPADVKLRYETLASSLLHDVGQFDPSRTDSAEQVYRTVLQNNELWTNDPTIQFGVLPEQEQESIQTLVQQVRWISQIGNEEHMKQPRSPESLTVALGLEPSDPNFVEQVWFTIALADEYGMDSSNLTQYQFDDLKDQRRSNIEHFKAMKNLEDQTGETFRSKDN